jgi:hypothetical protein
MTRVVPAALVARCATVGVRRRYFQHAFIHVVAVDMVQMTVMQVVRVTIVLNCRMAAAGTMLMRVTLDFRASSHIPTPFGKPVVDANSTTFPNNRS